MRGRGDRVSMLALLGLLCAGCLHALAQGIPSLEERIAHSSVSPEYHATWRSSWIELAPVPETEAEADGEADLPVFGVRLDFELPAETRAAGVSFYLPGLWAHRSPYWVAVNGVLLEGPAPGELQKWGLLTHDVTNLLRPGRNTLTVERHLGDPRHTRLTFEGIVFCEDGSTHRLLTTADGLRGGWNLPEGWDDPRADPGNLPYLEPGQPVTGQPDLVFLRPYYGPIQVTVYDPDGTVMREPIFDAGDTPRLRVILKNLRGAGAAELDLEMIALESRASLVKETLALEPAGRHDLVADLALDTLPLGCYRLRFVVSVEREEVDRRDYEIAVVGTIPQRVVEGTHYEDGLDLVEVWSVDCTAEPDPDHFVAAYEIWDRTPEEGVSTRVVETTAGRYRELTAATDRQYFAYRYRVKNLYRPHLAVVEWPDDARRNFIVHVKEAGTLRGVQALGWQRGEAGLVSRHDLHPERSGTLQRLHVLFWPNEEWGSIHIANVRGGERPAAAARITVYEIANDLPALRMADAGDRMIGAHSERGPYTMANTYYAGPLGSGFFARWAARNHPEFYRNWYTTTENLIKRMRFSGQNLYLMGQFMYHSTLYPSMMRRYGYAQNVYGGADHVRDYGGLLLRMFEHNDMHMISGIEHFYVTALGGADRSRAGRTRPSPIPTPEEIRAGVEHQFQVTREGGIFPLHAVRRRDGTWGGSGRPRPDRLARWPAMNYFHPEVQERFLALVGELADLYGGYPAWKGVALIVSRVMGPMEVAHLRSIELLEAGYEDFTVNLFEEETGIEVPVDARDPDRFEQRYQWLTTHAREAWLDWRTVKYTDLFLRLRDRIAGDRQDVKLYLVLGEPMLWSGSQELLDGRYDDPGFMRNVVRAFGFDLARLREEPGIVLSGTFALAGSGEALMAGDHEGWREQTLNDAWQGELANDARGGAYIKGNIPHYGGYTYPEGRWLFRGSGSRQGWFWSTHVNETFVNVMARSNPTWMPHTWMDVVESTGRIHELRTFARAYRSLPNGHYERLTDHGLDRNLWVSRLDRDGTSYLYAANLDWWAPEVTLSFGPGSRVHDLIRDEPALLMDGDWTFSLAPFSIRTFRIDAGDLLGGRVNIPDDARRYLEETLAATLAGARELLAAAYERDMEELKARVAGMEPLGAAARFQGDREGWPLLAELEGRVARIEKHLAAGDLAGAHRYTLGALPIVSDLLRNVLDGRSIERIYH